MLRDGWDREAVECFVSAVAEAAEDEEAEKRVGVVAPTAEKLKAARKVTGWPTLAKLLGTEGSGTVRQLRVRLGLTITLEQLAAHKRLPIEHLQSLGLHDLLLGGVGIPFYDPPNAEPIIKVRTVLAAGEGSYWPKGRRLLAYGEQRLDAAAAAGYQVLVEGESDCWTLWFHGYPALGLPGADTVAQTLERGHLGSVPKVYVLREPDQGGEDFVRNVTTRVAEIGWTGQLLVVRLDAFKDPSDLYKDAPERFKERFQSALDRAEEPPVSAAPLVPDIQPPPWPDPPAEEAFFGLAGRIVRTIEPASEADPAALLVQTLVAFGSVVGRAAYFTVEADRHHGNEYAVLVGRTSKARKGTSWGRVHRLFREAEEQWATEHVQTGLSSGEGLIWTIRDAIIKRERIKDKGGVRYEEVVADPGIEDKRLLVYEPEFANVLKQTERQGNTLSAILRQAWDGSDLRTMVKLSPARSTGAHVSLIGHITADELRRYLTQTETANGFANRHLWICADRSKELPEGGRVDPEVWAGLRDDLTAALGFAQASGDEVRGGEEVRPASSVFSLRVTSGPVGEMHRDEEARAIWREVYGPLSAGKPGLAGALLARGEAHVMRLALLYALLDRSAVIRAPHLLAALALWDYAERSVYFIFGDDLGDPVADDLLRLLRGCPHGLTRNELRDYFGRHQSSDRIGRALGLLLQLGRARFERQDTGGRPAERWFATARTGGGTYRA